MILDLTPSEMAVTVASLAEQRSRLENEPVPAQHASARAMGLVTIDDVLDKCERVLRTETGT